MHCVLDVCIIAQNLLFNMAAVPPESMASTGIRIRRYEHINRTDFFQKQANKAYYRLLDWFYFYCSLLFLNCLIYVCVGLRLGGSSDVKKMLKYQIVFRVAVTVRIHSA